MKARIVPVLTITWTLAQLVCGQTTAPSTQPSAAVTALLDAVRSAYTRPGEYNVAGTLSIDMDVAGQSHVEKHQFTSSFAAPTRFRHELQGDLLIACDSKEAFVHKIDQNRYMKLETAADGEAPGIIVNQLREQNPALLMAISKDPVAALTEGSTEISSADDVAIAGQPQPALRIATRQRDLVVVVDSQTKRLCRVVADYSRSLNEAGVPAVKRAIVTIDYTGAPAGPVAYHWTPPADAVAIKPVEASADTAPGTEGAEQAMIGQPAPEFTLKDLDGNPVSLKDLRGRVVLLDFWATWCGPCRMAMPHLEGFHKELADQGVKVFGINLRENAATVRKFMDAQKFTMPILLDADGKVAASYRVSGIPHTVIIGKDGQVLKVNVGYAPGVEEQLKQALLNAARQ